MFVPSLRLFMLSTLSPKLHSFPFSSPLPPLTCLRFVEHMFGKTEAKFPDDRFPTIQDLCNQVIKSFSPRCLELCQRGKKISVGGQARPLESQDQDEFYRCFGNVVPEVTLSSEWSRSGNGWLDFWLKSRSWGVEFMRAGHPKQPLK